METIYKLFVSLLFAMLLLNVSCNTTEPTPPNNGTLNISLTDVSCTEAWISLKSNGVTFPVNVNFLADGSTVAQLNNLNSSDTTVYIDSLLPNKTYNIQAIIQSTNQYQATNSNKLAVQTLDTTSNNFTWQTYTFGASNAGSSILYDVAIINDNDIWAVGEIYMDDSTGQPDPTPYNAVHWDGNTWEIKRIPFLYNGQNFYGPIYAVFEFSDQDIWFGIGNMIYWNGIQYIPITIPTASWGPNLINKIWGSSDNDLYIVGNSGSIAHYNGSTWQKIESGTGLNIYDIWGDYNADKTSYEIYAVASQYGLGNDRRILRITSNNSDSLTTNGAASIKGIWFKAADQYYVVGDGIYRKQDIVNSADWQKINYGLPQYYIDAVRGNSINDIFMCGDFGEMLHFNGYSWRSYLNSPNGSEILFSLAIRGNKVVTVGIDNPYAIINIGKR